jgi:16S rRNA (cytidine1402-2'-O)-methyltransferase
MSGLLYVVSLPIGNLADITLRAIETLRKVDYILAEDTRTTKRVLDQYGIGTPFYSSLYEGVEDGRVSDLVARLVSGKSIALVSDAGTPTISDPGFPLVRAAVAAGVAVCPVPGPTAAIAALVASSLPTDRFVFEGSLPRKQGRRKDFFAQLRSERRTTVAYESSHRLQETLRLLDAELPERQIVVARELTKIHEEFLRGRAAEVARTFAERGEVRGECVLLVAGAESLEGDVDAGPLKAFLAVADEEGLPKRSLERLLMAAFGIPRNRAYELAHRDHA